MDASRLAVVDRRARRGGPDRGDASPALRDAFPGALVVVADDGSPRRDGARSREQAGAQVVRLARPHRARAAPPRRRPRSRWLRRPSWCCSATPTSATAPRGCAPLLTRRRARRGATSRSRSSRAASAAASASPSASRTGRSSTSRASTCARRSPASGRCAPRCSRPSTPFAPRFGMEIGMTVDAVRAGLRVVEVEVDLEHRATGRTLGGFVHRFRQLRDFTLVYASRRLRARLIERARGRRRAALPGHRPGLLGSPVPSPVARSAGSSRPGRCALAGRRPCHRRRRAGRAVRCPRLRTAG